MVDTSIYLSSRRLRFFYNMYASICKRLSLLYVNWEWRLVMIYENTINSEELSKCV